MRGGAAAPSRALAQHQGTKNPQPTLALRGSCGRLRKPQKNWLKETIRDGNGFVNRFVQPFTATDLISVEIIRRHAFGFCCISLSINSIMASLCLISASFRIRLTTRHTLLTHTACPSPAGGRGGYASDPRVRLCSGRTQGPEGAKQWGENLQRSGRREEYHSPSRSLAISR